MAIRAIDSPTGVHVGCSGWDYKEWNGVVYPAHLPRGKWFGYYASRFDTVEINNTFYRLPGPDTIDRWAERAPAGFTYAVKMSRFGSHNKKLKDPDSWWGSFADRVAPLADHLGPVLVQLPPRWRPNVGRLREFLEVAGDTRIAIELRNPEWLGDDLYGVLEHHDAALVWHDLIEDHPRVATAGWVYQRFHGPRALDEPYRGSYHGNTLRAAARRLAEERAAGRDVFAYFNNDVGGCAATDAASLLDKIASELA